MKPLIQTRRDFLRSGAAAAGGLVIGLYLPPLSSSAAAQQGAAFAPNAWLRVAPDNTVTIILAKSEMGQGVMTSMPMLVAEELEAEWSAIRVEQSPVDAAYNNPNMGGMVTAGSTSVRTSWLPLRRAGAAARLMLVQAAAQTWGVEEGSCHAEKSFVIHRPTGRRLSYGELAAKAAALPVPENPPLKSSADFDLIGRPVPRVDVPRKVDGSAVFGLDVKLPGLLVARVARCPVFGGRLESFDPARARAIPGVRHVLQIDSGVAVVADSYWAASKGIGALDVRWNEGANARLSSAQIESRFSELAQKEGATARREGDAAAALAAASRRIDAVYAVPYLAHATMEPMNCTAHVRSDGCEVWLGTQGQTGVQETAAHITGLPARSIKVHTMFLGGGFGRRGGTDVVSEAVQVSKAVGAPVKVIWTREDDMQHDFYRPANYCRLSAGLDAAGLPVAWTHRIVGPSILARQTGGRLRDGIDRTSVEGAANLPYSIPNIHVDYILDDPGIPVGFWRSVGNSINGYVTESFFDEVAVLGGHDPYELRRRLLDKAPRHRAVLDLAAEKAGWSRPPAPGRHRGIAVHFSYASWVAEVAEVSVSPEGEVRVHRVVCAADCGSILNPSTLETQIEGAMVWGLTAALKGEITIRDGRVEQSNFHDYPMLRMGEMPQVEVHFVASAEPPGGGGEPGAPPIAPAVVNAIFSATGRRIRRLPIRAADLKAV